MISKRFLLFIPFFLLRPALSASCGCASCPIEAPSKALIAPGDLVLDFSEQSILQDQPRIGRRKAAAGEISGHHDEVETYNLIRTLTVTAGLTQRLSLEFVMPMIHREHRHIHNHMGTPVPESWNFDGMGDLQTRLHLDILKSKGAAPAALSIMAGVEFPTGRDHAANADGDEAEPGLLASDGAYAFLAGLGWRKDLSAKTATGAFARAPLFFSTTYQWNRPSFEDYRIGDIWTVNAGAAYPALPRLSLLGQANMRINRPDARGQTFEEVEKTGGTFVYLSPGFQLGLSDAAAAYVLVQVPVYQRVNRIQLTSRYNFMMGLSYRFSVLQ